MCTNPDTPADPSALAIDDEGVHQHASRSPASSVQRHQEVKETPLPKLQLFLLLYLQLAEPITSTVIYPFVNQLVRETGITGGDERKTGYFAGLIESSFYAVEAICVLQWGRASDRMGRKPILLGGLPGLTLSMIGFGLSTKYWALILSRCAEGALNGNIGVTKSMMAEITDSTNRARGFAYMPMIWALGSTVGPIIGGVFSRPADGWPPFRHGAFWRTYPYFLPCIVTACISISAFMLALFGLKETLPRTFRNTGSDTERTATLYRDAQSQQSVSAAVVSEGDNVIEVVRVEPLPNLEKNDLPDTGVLVDKVDSETPVTIRTILVPRVLWPIINYGFLALTDQCVVVLVPLMYSTSIPLGGLGFTTFTIGLIQGVAGFVGGIVQVFSFPWMQRKLGSKWLYTLSYSMFVVVFALFPLISFLTKREGKVRSTTWVLVVLQFVAYVNTYMTWGCIFMYISDGAPNQRALGLTNGFAQTTASTVRAIAPAASSSLFSVSLEQHLLEAGSSIVYCA
ncbi:MFS general substrate transporter [Dichomitus squalens LYAD-421 SS1]|uniref:MFS general substrate transporter n=1 Tax=Dichomitus squalens (strain LYAD-421) TaxID=732165 RepID=UPI00044114DA|nr:MFS general substrate transporter [Dichomitus squalens LYAD-421 SS1]EJF64508.1 MFS general substrate transporter [Dichomitus squalens LYAD-421 SS1]